MSDCPTCKARREADEEYGPPLFPSSKPCATCEAARRRANAVEVAAKRQFERDDLGSARPEVWEDVSEAKRQEYREDAECVIEAVAPIFAMGKA